MTLLKPGETCWRPAQTGRVAFLVDTQAYYAALFEALLRAERSVFILGWAFDPRTRLLPDGKETPSDPDEIGRVLTDLSRIKPKLDVRILIWRSAISINGAPAFLPHRARLQFAGTSVKFRLAGDIPLGACHHQKVVVIDDQLAFCGGGDVVTNRWDTPEHRHEEPRRLLPQLRRHAPRHEVMAMVDGAAALDLGELFRARWRDAGGSARSAQPSREIRLWPSAAPLSCDGAAVAIARTAPAWRERPAVKEIRALTLACIKQAKRTIYLENQYFTSPEVAAALAARLAEPAGPEVVLITTGRAPSWFDHLTMDRARSPVLRDLRAADRYNRFRALFPRTTGGKPITVHSKVGVFDDTIARIGSANLNNRSAGFDTECELAVLASRRSDRRSIAALRNGLIAHFLWLEASAFAAEVGRCGSLVGAIDNLNLSGRLEPIPTPELSALGELIATYQIGDPADVGDSWRCWRRKRARPPTDRPIGRPLTLINER